MLYITLNNVLGDDAKGLARQMEKGPHVPLVRDGACDDEVQVAAECKQDDGYVS